MRISNRRRQSRLAMWSRRASISATPVLLLAIIGHRADFFDADVTLALLAIGLTLAFCGILAALIAFGAIWREGRRGFAAAMLGLVLGLALLAYPTFLFTRLIALPAIADVTTSPDDVLGFSEVDWDHPPPPPAVIAAQRTAYPEVLPRTYAADPEFAFEEVVLAVDALGWDIVRQEPPTVFVPPPDPVSPGSPAPASADGLPPGSDPLAVPLTEAMAEAVATPGFVEAVARTPVVGFREDVIIRVRADPAGVVVDIRSASRFFQHDFGSNAARITRLFAELDERLAQVTSD